MNYVGKSLIILGVILIVAGILFIVGGKITWLGRLPGDIVIHRKNFSFYFPITTCLLISAVLSLIYYLFFRQR